MSVSRLVLYLCVCMALLHSGSTRWRWKWTVGAYWWKCQLRGGCWSTRNLRWHLRSRLRPWHRSPRISTTCSSAWKLPSITITPVCQLSSARGFNSLRIRYVTNPFKPLCFYMSTEYFPKSWFALLRYLYSAYCCISDLYSSSLR